MPILIQKSSSGASIQQWDLKEKPLVFGRGKDADVRIEDTEMSRRHFRIGCEANSHELKDLDSTNGTWLNGVRISTAKLQAGDLITAGRTVFLFEKGLGTMIGELAKERKGYHTLLNEISQEARPRTRKK